MGHRDSFCKWPVPRLTPHFNVTLRFTAPFSEDDHRPIRQHIRDTGWLHVVNLEFAKIDLNSGQDRRLNEFPELLGLFGGLFRLAYDKRFSHANPCHALDEMAIDTGSDSKSKHIGIAEIISDQVKGLRFNGHISIGGNDDGSGVSFRFGQCECPFECWQEPGTASPPLPFNKVYGLADVLWSSG